MENKPFIDPGVLAPALLGVLSVAGILVIFFGGVAASRPAGEPIGTETPFRYIYLGTEPSLSTLTPEPTETPIVLEPIEPSDTPDFIESPFLTGTPISPFFTAPPASPAFPTQPVRVTSTFTPTATETLQATLAKYDDTYFEILYDGWTSQANVTGAYQNTLHISFEIENYVLFTFVGEQIIISYQAGPSLGEILIDLDGIEFIVDQSSSQTQLVEWRSQKLVRGTHQIVIEHLSGGSVNIDSITIPDLSTPTPTTPTP